MSKFVILFLLVYFGGMLAALFYSGSAAFVVYQLVYFLNPDNRWWATSIPGLRYSFISVLFMLLVYALRYNHYNNMSPWREQRSFKWMLFLLLMYYFANLVALDPVGHSNTAVDFTKLIIIMLVAYKLIDTKRAFDASLWTYIVGAFYIGYLAFVTGRNSGDRVEGIGMIDSPDGNDTAAALVPAAVLLMYFAWQGGKYSKALAIVMGGVIINAIVLINSRGAFLGVVASMGIFLSFMVFSRHQKKGQKSTAIAVVILGLSGALYLTDEVFWERMGTLSNEDSSVSGSKRTELWWVTFDMMEDHPFGVGVNGYNILAPFYADEDARGSVLNRSVHSSWFQGLSEVGYLGFLAFVTMMATLLRQAGAAKRYLISRKQFEDYFKILAVQSALLGYMVSATFINRFRAETLYWMILFLALAIKLYHLQPAKEEAKQLAEASKPKSHRGTSKQA